jgi:hypothetical protein
MQDRQRSCNLPKIRKYLVIKTKGGTPSKENLMREIQTRIFFIVLQARSVSFKKEISGILPGVSDFYYIDIHAVCGLVAGDRLP